MDTKPNRPLVCYPMGRFVPVLSDRLRELSYPAFSACLGQVLLGLGYRDVALSDRMFDRGRTGSPGIDFTASLPAPLGNLPICGQFKRYERVRVSRQHVAVLAAAMRRRGIAQGLMIATGEFSVAAREEAAADPGRPVRLVDGVELARAMIDARIGCVRATDWISGEPRYLINESFFERLERRYGRDRAEMKS